MIDEDEARVIFKYQQVTRALPKSLKEDFVKMDNEKQELFGIGEQADKVVTHFPKDLNEFNNFVGYQKNQYGKSSQHREFSSKTNMLVLSSNRLFSF